MSSKRQIFKLMLRIWSSKIIERQNRHSHHRRAYQLKCLDNKETVEQVPIESLRSTREETDTRVILYLNFDKENGLKNTVVHLSDSDIFFIVLYYAHKLAPLTIYLDTSSGANRRIMNRSDLAEDFGASFCKTLLGIYCFTGEDCNCAFKGKGKTCPIKKLDKKTA